MADVLCAGHAIKEILTASECLAALEAGVKRAGANVAGSFVISDGGDGFLEASARIFGGEQREAACTAPLGDSITAPFLYEEEKRVAAIEMAYCCGLRIVDPERRNIMISGTAGLGDLVAAAREAGARRILVGLGGSATCDGGIGFLWRLADHAGQCAPGMCEPRVAMDMPDLPAPDIAAIRAWLGDIELVGLCDVDNPLRGPNGAAKIFAPQKGADEIQTEQLDAWMGDWCERVQRNAGVELCQNPGTGAAGGMGFAMAVIGAQLIPGAEAMCEMSGLTAALKPEKTLICAEGRFDNTSLGGKAPWTASTQALDKGARAVIFCGVSEEGAAQIAQERGIAVVEYARDLPESERKSRSADMLTEAVANTMRNGTQG